MAAICLVLGALCANASAEWLFRPLGADGASDLCAPGLDDSGWEAVTLPHRTWDDAQPRNYVYGWYRYHFTPDPAFAGRDVVLKLGIVDDVDATYCNGTLVGSTGAFPPKTASAYNQDREYVIPAGLLTFGADNVLAVKVYDTIGTGGLLGDGRLGYRLAEGDTWLVKSMGGDAATDLSDEGLDDSGWERAPMPDVEWDARQPGANVVGWYRLHFAVPEAWRGRPLVVDLGMVLDADETYVNGRCIARNGGFPPAPVSAAGEPRCYEIPPEALRYGAGNVLAVKVFNGEARGGIWGIPAVLIAGDGEPSGLLHARRLRYAGHVTAAWQVLAGLWEHSDEPDVRADVLDELTSVYHALGRDDDALESFSLLMAQYPQESCSRDAVRAVAAIQTGRGALGPDALSLGEDRLTKGDWRCSYGNDGFCLCAMGWDCDVYGEPGWASFSDPGAHGTTPQNSPLRYRAVLFGEPDETPYNWSQDGPAAGDARLLRDPITRRQVWACWDDKGERHPCDNSGPDIGARVEVPDGWWRVSVYLLDWDWAGTWHPRQYGIVLLDADNQVLAAQDTGKLGAGAWVRFAVRGPREVTVRVCKSRSASATVCGVFQDRWFAPEPLPESLVATADERPLAAAYAKISAAREPGGEWLTAVAGLEAQLGARADAGQPASQVTGWMAWQLQSIVSPLSPAARAGLHAWAEGLGETASQVRLETLGALADSLYSQRRFGPARAVTDELDAAMDPSGDAAVDEVKALAASVQRWAEVDDEYALSRFDRWVARLQSLDEGRAADLLAAAASVLADVPDIWWPRLEGEFRPGRTGDNHAPQPIPTPVSRIARWFAARDPQLAQAHAAAFFQRRGEEAVRATEEAYGAFRWGEVISGATTALEAQRLLPDAVTVGRAHVQMCRALEMTADADQICAQLAATGAVGSRTPEEALYRALLYCSIGLPESAAAEVEAVRGQLSALWAGQQWTALEALARARFVLGDPEAAEAAARDGLAVAEDPDPPAARGPVTLAAYRVLAALYAYRGDKEGLEALGREVEAVLQAVVPPDKAATYLEGLRTEVEAASGSVAGQASAR